LNFYRLLSELHAGKDQVGIFRLSGRASEIDMFQEQFNAGHDVQFSAAVGDFL